MWKPILSTIYLSDRIDDLWLLSLLVNLGMIFVALFSFQILGTELRLIGIMVMLNTL